MASIKDTMDINSAMVSVLVVFLYRFLQTFDVDISFNPTRLGCVMAVTRLDYFLVDKLMMGFGVVTAARWVTS